MLFDAFKIAIQCCDADAYLEIGSACAGNWTQCWDPLRPVGSILYFSIPTLSGVPPAFMIFLNSVLIACSALLSYRSLRIVFSVETVHRRALILLVSLAVHGLFFFPTARNTLADTPGAIFVLIGLWLLILGEAQGSRIKPMLGGLFLGLAVWMRAFYLYPVAIAALAHAVLSFRRAGTAAARGSLVGFLIAVALPPLAQIAATYAAVGKWSFLDPGTTARNSRYHLHSAASGYDTLIPPAGHQYFPAGCGKDSLGVLGLVRAGNWQGLICLLRARQVFYFGSYASASYLLSLGERTFSGWIIVAHLGASILFVVALIRSRRLRAVWTATLLAGMIWAEATLIQPEQRFVLVTQVLVWVWALSGGGLWLRQAWSQLRERRQNQSGALAVEGAGPFGIDP